MNASSEGKTGKNGFSMVEVLLALLIASIIMIIIWRILLHGFKQGDTAEKKLTGLKFAVIAHKRLMSDLQRLPLSTEDGLTEVGKNSDVLLRLLVWTPDESALAGGRIPLRRIVYLRREDRRYSLYRKEGERKPAKIRGYFDTDFRLDEEGRTLLHVISAYARQPRSKKEIGKLATSIAGIYVSRRRRLAERAPWWWPLLDASSRTEK